MTSVGAPCDEVTPVSIESSHSRGPGRGRRAGRRGGRLQSPSRGRTTVPVVDADSSYCLFHGYLMRDDEIAFIDDEYRLPEPIYRIADKIQQRMAPEWKARVGYTDKRYLSPAKHSDDGPVKTGTDADYDASRDPALVLAIEHNDWLMQRRRTDDAVSWLHKRYWRCARRLEYNGEIIIGPDPHGLLCQYLRRVPDAWLESASEGELRERLSMLVKVAREGFDSTAMLEEEDAKAVCRRQQENQNTSLGELVEELQAVAVAEPTNRA